MMCEAVVMNEASETITRLAGSMRLVALQGVVSNREVH